MYINAIECGKSRKYFQFPIFVLEGTPQKKVFFCAIKEGECKGLAIKEKRTFFPTAIKL